jgi:HD-like signal output (HDOD) protein
MSTTTAPNSSALASKAIASITGISTLPEVTNKIIATVEDPKSSAAALHKIISHDPALVTRILKVVNSSFYGLPGQVSSVDRAIVMLGLNAVKNIAVAASLGQLFRGTKLGAGYSAKDLWKHCVAVGVTAKEISKTLKLPIAEEAFLAGLIHDIGLLVALQVWPEKLREVCDRAAASPGASFTELEQQIIGVDHQQLGLALAQKWQFPRPCQMVAGFHHEPGLPSESGRQIVAIVHVADVLAARASIGLPLTAQHAQIDPMLLTQLNLSPQQVEQIQQQIPQYVSSVAMLME